MTPHILSLPDLPPVIPTERSEWRDLGSARTKAPDAGDEIPPLRRPPGGCGRNDGRG